MYIKYLENIHIVENYFSLVKGGGKQDNLGVTPNNCIYLQRSDSHFALTFLDEKARDYVLAKIWEELEKKTECFNVDELVDIYYLTNNYNL